MYNFFCFCVLDLPELDLGKITFFAIMAVTFITHCVLGWKIWKKKRSLFYLGSGVHHQPVVFICQVQPQVEANVVANNSNSQYNHDLTSMLDHKSSLIFLILVLLLTPTVAMLVLFLGMPQMLMRITGLSSLLLVLPLSVYIRKPHVRTTLARELAEALSRH